MPSVGRVLAVLSLLGAGVIHISQAPTHFAEWGPAGVTFLALAGLEGLFAVLLAARPARGVVVGALLLSAITILLWLGSRTIGVPFGPDPWIPEPVGRPDSAATTLEATTLVALLPLLRRRPKRDRSIRGYAGVGVSVALVGTLAWIGVQAPAGCGGHGGGVSLTGPLVAVDGHSILSRTTPAAVARVGEEIGLVVGVLRSCGPSTIEIASARVITVTNFDHAADPASFWVLPPGEGTPGRTVPLGELRMRATQLPGRVSVPRVKASGPASMLVLLVRALRPGGFAVNGLEIRYRAGGHQYLGIYADIARLEVHG